MPDANPPTVAASLDKTTYAKGEKVTLTVTYGDADAKTLQVTTTATDASGGSGTASVALVITDPVTVKVSDSDGHVWSKVSDTGSVAVFTTLA